MKNSRALKAKSALITDLNGKIFFKKNINKLFHPASLTKLMTIKIILDNIDKNTLNWNDMVTISSKAASIRGSKVGLKPGDKLNVRDIFKSMIIASANDASIAIAEHLSGNVKSFVAEMNTQAKKLGLSNSHFLNPHGLSIKNHYSTALDISKLATILLKRKEVLLYSKLKEDYITINNRKKKIINTNTLLKKRDEIDGLKTGHTSLAGYCLAATAQQNNKRLIVIVLGEPNKTTRDKEVLELFDHGFKLISKVNKKSRDIQK